MRDQIFQGSEPAGRGVFGASPEWAEVASPGDPGSALLALLHQNVETPGSINEHLYTLCDYAKRCTSVCEMGVFQGASTSALASGLMDNGSVKKQLLCIDTDDCSGVPALRLAPLCGIAATFVRGDSAKVEIPPVDLLFIDTWHCYGHLRRELARHHGRVAKWIILHDTAIDFYRGESVRMGEDLIALAERTGYTIDEMYRGLGGAIEEFLEGHPEWGVERVFPHNNGLTVLARR